jgi:deoxyribonuclease V
MPNGGYPAGGVFVAVDVQYLASGGARAAAVVTADATFSRLVAERTELVPDVAPYRPGLFYLRELPPMRAVLEGLSEMALLVVDGYADLDPDGKPGLGAHACAEFAVPVIGVAKSAFRTATQAVPVLRGTSRHPLYVTAAGMPRNEAADIVRHMAGAHRIPDALRRADSLARHGLSPEPRASESPNS